MKLFAEWDRGGGYVFDIQSRFKEPSGKTLQADATHKRWANLPKLKL